MKLNYKASNIAKAESETGKNFFNIIANLGNNASVSDLMFLFNAGGGTLDEFDATFASGVESVMIAIMEGINDAGFLGEKIDIEAMKKEMEKVKANFKTSPATGEANKN